MFSIDSRSKVGYVKVGGANVERTDAKFSEFFLDRELRGVDEGPVTYTTDDLSGKWV